VGSNCCSKWPMTRSPRRPSHTTLTSSDSHPCHRPVVTDLAARFDVERICLAPPRAGRRLAESKTSVLGRRGVIANPRLGPLGVHRAPLAPTLVCRPVSRFVFNCAVRERSRCASSVARTRGVHSMPTTFAAIRSVEVNWESKGVVQFETRRRPRSHSRPSEMSSRRESPPSIVSKKRSSRYGIVFAMSAALAIRSGYALPSAIDGRMRCTSRGVRAGQEARSAARRGAGCDGTTYRALRFEV